VFGGETHLPLSATPNASTKACIEFGKVAAIAHLEVLGGKPTSALTTFGIWRLCMNHERTGQNECGDAGEEFSHARIICNPPHAQGTL
jgi:hypothetical protein